jgi:hypothetical protein
MWLFIIAEIKEYTSMHVNFDPVQVDWTFFTPPNTMDMFQSGGGVMMGSAASYPVFSGMTYQRGAGLGSVLRSLWRFLLPLGRQAGAAIGRQGLETGARVLSGVLDGKDVKETVVSEGKAGLKSLLDKASDNLSRQKGSGGSFDFKRYKRNVEEGGEEKDIKRRLLSTIGPSIAIQERRRRVNKAKRKRTTTHKRIDALGAY